jgi:hypothetical protein
MKTFLIYYPYHRSVVYNLFSPLDIFIVIIFEH